MTIREEKLTVNIAAIMHLLYTHEAWSDIYKVATHNPIDAWDGTVGMWFYCVDLAGAFTDAELAISPGYDTRWVDALEDYIDAFADFVVEKRYLPPDLGSLAVAAVNKSAHNPDEDYATWDVPHA